ncbi:MAG: IS110 family transposase [Actinomycetota bacterium]
MVSIGIDSHKATLAAAAVDDVGRVLKTHDFANDPDGHRQLSEWVTGFEGFTRVGIECSGSFGSSAARFLGGRGHEVFEVPANLSHREARRQNRGKSDPIDAVAIARVVARGDALPRPRSGGPFEDLKLLSDHLDHLKRLRTQLANRIHSHLMVARPGYEKKIGALTADKSRRAILMMLRGDHSVRAELVRRNVRELRRLDAEMKELRVQIRVAVTASGTSLTEHCGIGSTIAARLLGEIGDVRNIRSKGGFARLTGTAPIPASSGRTVRHRLNRGGNRKLNYALHFIAVTRCRLDDDTKQFMARKMSEGKTRKEAMRCLKRHLSNQIYRMLEADAKRLGDLGVEMCPHEKPCEAADDRQERHQDADHPTGPPAFVDVLSSFHGKPKPADDHGRKCSEGEEDIPVRSSVDVHGNDSSLMARRRSISIPRRDLTT